MAGEQLSIRAPPDAKLRVSESARRVFLSGKEIKGLRGGVL